MWCAKTKAKYEVTAKIFVSVKILLGCGFSGWLGSMVVRVSDGGDVEASGDNFDFAFVPFPLNAPPVHGAVFGGGTVLHVGVTLWVF